MPSGESTSSVPSSASTRWRRPPSPLPRGFGAARAVVGDLHHQARSGAADRDPHRGARSVLDGIGQRLRGDEVGRGLHHGSEPLGELALHRGVDAGALGQRLDGGHQAAVGQHRRGDAAREVAQLGHCGGGLLACLADELGRLGPVLQPGLGAAQLHRQRHQPRLGAVVEVALDAAQLRRLDVEHAPARPGELVDARAEVGPARRDEYRVQRRRPWPGRPPGTPARSSRTRTSPTRPRSTPPGRRRSSLARPAAAADRAAGPTPAARPPGARSAARGSTTPTRARTGRLSRPR